MRAGHESTFSWPEGHNAVIAVLRGAVSANGSREAKDAELVLFDRTGSDVRIAAAVDSTLLLLGGALIPEPIVGYGPFVMNSRQEIETALNDLRMGKFGHLPPSHAHGAA
jgi:redox-sensitive bicupin YhaK (pirin superfamily)